MELDDFMCDVNCEEREDWYLLLLEDENDYLTSSENYDIINM